MSTSNMLLGTSGKTLIMQLIPGNSSTGFAGTLSMSGDGNYIATFDYFSPLYVYLIVYVRIGATFVHQQTLTLPLSLRYDSICFDDTGQRCVVGGSNGGLDIQRGNAAVYVRSGSTWSLEQDLTPLVGLADYDEFGYDVSISGDGNYVAIGSPRTGNGTFPSPGGLGNGAVYTFVRSGLSNNK